MIYYTIPSDNRELQRGTRFSLLFLDYTIPSDNRELQPGVSVNATSSHYTREFDTLKFKKVPQSLETGLFFCQIFIFII